MWLVERPVAHEMECFARIVLQPQHWALELCSLGKGAPEGVSGVGEPWKQEYKTGGRSGFDSEFSLRAG